MELNDLQKLVVDTLDQNIWLVASAGTGKTSTLAYRVANIVDKQSAEPKEILCLTFTNRACLEIKSKVEEIVGAFARDIVVKTFHSFCSDIVRLTAKKNSDIFNDFVVFDEEDCKTLIAKTFNNYEVAGIIQNFIKQIKITIGLEDFYSENKIDDYQNALNYLYENDQRFIQNLFRDHTNLNKRLQVDGAAHGLDFEDLIIYANKALQDEEIRSFWTNKFKFINIDEVQDTSKLEYKIISKIFGDSNLLLCGDPFQTIYEWRGSDPKLVEEQFKRNYQPKIIVLDTNYRATKTLLKASYSYLKQRFNEQVTEIYPENIKIASAEDGEKIILHYADYIQDEAQWIYHQIKNLNVDDITKICVLTRDNKYNERLAEAFEKINQSMSEKIPFMLIGEFYFFRRQEIKDVLAFMKFAVNKHDTMSLERVLERFIEGIGEKTIKEITSEEFRQSGARLTDFVDPSTHNFGDPYEELLQALETDNVVIFDVESTGLDTTTDEIVQIAAIRINADGTIKSKFEKFLKPSKSVGRSVNVHHFTDKFLELNGQEPKKVFEEFRKFAENAVIVGHNVNYDLSILTSQMNRLKMSPLIFKNYYDTLDIFRRFYPNLDNYKLEFLGEMFEVKHKSSHNAFDDICATAEILIYAVKNNILPMLETRRKFIKKHLNKFIDAMNLMTSIRDKVNFLRPYELMSEIIDTFDIKNYYQKEQDRIKYLEDLKYLVKDLDDPKISPFDATQRILQYTTLSNTELFLKNDKKIPVITVHQAKGMEFDFVFVAGLMENIFPSYRSLLEKRIEEEERLFYVAITRAKKKLFLSYTKFDISKEGNFYQKIMSRFVNDISKFIQRI